MPHVEPERCFFVYIARNKPEGTPRTKPLQYSISDINLQNGVLAGDESGLSSHDRSVAPGARLAFVADLAGYGPSAPPADALICSCSVSVHLRCTSAPVA